MLSFLGKELPSRKKGRMERKGGNPVACTHLENPVDYHVKKFLHFRFPYMGLFLLVPLILRDEGCLADGKWDSRSTTAIQHPLSTWQCRTLVGFHRARRVLGLGVSRICIPGSLYIERINFDGDALRGLYAFVGIQKSDVGIPSTRIIGGVLI